MNESRASNPRIRLIDTITQGASDISALRHAASTGLSAAEGSKSLLEDSVKDIERLLNSDIGSQIGVSTRRAFLMPDGEKWHERTNNDLEGGLFCRGVFSGLAVFDQGAENTTLTMDVDFSSSERLAICMILDPVAEIVSGDPFAVQGRTLIPVDALDGPIFQ